MGLKDTPVLSSQAVKVYPFFDKFVLNLPFTLRQAQGER